MSDEDVTRACPHCDTAGRFYRRAGRGNASAGDPSKTYHCGECRQSFDEPVVRSSRSKTGASAGSGIAVSSETIDRVKKMMTERDADGSGTNTEDT